MAEAGDGAEAVALAREGGVDLVVLDIAMPTMTGLQALREIARSLTISVKTVERHRANILATLGMRDQTQLTRSAIRAGLVDP